MRVSNMSINILKQSLAVIVQRVKYGASYDNSGSATLDDTTTEKTLLSVTGAGFFHRAHFKAVVGAGSPTTEDTRFSVKIDGQIIIQTNAESLNDQGFGHSSWWVQLIKYSAGGECRFAFCPPSGMSFETSIELTAQGVGTVDASNTVTATGYATYQLI